MKTDTRFVKLLVDIHCVWKDNPPNYRVYINGELFTDRTFDYEPNQYLEEVLQVEAPQGQYQIEYEILTDHYYFFDATNLRVIHGPARVINNNTFEIV